jgi:predicted dehydrogenase/aryl-alcohol dehydrogenase-like predicted oxidoreductase
MADKLNWGLLAAGRIAGALAKGLKDSHTGTAYAVASRSLEKAEAFAKEHDIPTAYGSYEELLADPKVDVVYVATPHPMHAEWVIKAAEAGKHILCEKPTTLNHADTMTVIEAARRNDVFFMEAFMYRCNPQTAKLVELIRDGAIGEVRMIRATFGFGAGFKPESRLFNSKLGGGGILDVGCYATSMARLIAGAALGKDIAEPIEVTGAGHLGESGVDEWTAATLKFEGGIVAQVATSIRAGLDNTVLIFGSEGSIEIPQPWFCTGKEAGESSIILRAAGKDEETITVTASTGLYAIEVDTVAANIAARQAPCPAMSWADTLGNMNTLDQWRAAIGLTYPGESAEAYAMPLDNSPLAVRDGSTMKYGELDGVGKPISRLIMGCDNQLTIAHATAMFDDFFARGGNAFDTAWIYGGGLQEKMLGQWLANRDIREDVVVIAKGAHTPKCTPEGIVAQLNESLERLQTDYADIYFMHRDNPDVPVGEFVTILNELRSAGKLRAFGGSNWTRERLDEANAYAAANGMQGFGAVSNNFSLAEMIDSVWAGCIAASTPEYRAWLTEKQMPVFAWSSQARGFFVPGRAAPDIHSDAQLERCWYSKDNFERQSRCFALAKERNLHPTAIALAYVLHQPFPIFTLIGPRAISETVSSFDGLTVELSEQEVKWLNLESGERG